MKSQRGFSLIEVIVVLVLVGMLAAMAGLGLSIGVRGYLLAAENAELTQKAQLAMKRISREILECFDCDTSIPTDVTSPPYTFTNTLGVREIDRDSSELTLNDNTLVNRVNSFSIRRLDDGRIDITLELNHVSGGTTRTFATSILPRNI